MKKTALLTGITGQDGYYLASFLRSLNYRVIGLIRSESGASKNIPSLEYFLNAPAIELRKTSLLDQSSWNDLVADYQPDEIYHLAGVSFVPDSWNDPIGTVAANVDVTLHILEAIRNCNPTTKMFYACSSEIFGRPTVGPQNEQTALAPNSPYGVTKAASHGMIAAYRQRYNLFACSGILFNHESPRRPTTFVTRKISAATAAIANGQQDSLMLGCLDAQRDWGYAGDFVDCMWRMLQSNHPKDYVIGTGQLTSIRRLLDIAFEHVGLDWNNYVSIDQRFAHSKETNALYADASAAANDLNWRPQTPIDELLRMMVDHDLTLSANQAGQLRAA